MALAVPLSRFTPQVGGGSAFFVRPLGTLFADSLEMKSYRLVSSGSAHAGWIRRASAELVDSRAVIFTELF